MEVRTPALERRVRLGNGNGNGNGEASREALLAQLDTMSADDVQNLLKRVLEARMSSETLRPEPELP
jgi:hypothetical protein